MSDEVSRRTEYFLEVGVHGGVGRRWTRIAGTLFFVLAVGCTAGADEASAPPPEDTGDFEHIVLDRTSYPGGERSAFNPEFSTAAAEEEPGAGPCSCETAACLQEWADLNLGCDVCVSVVCDGEPGPHVCHACAPADDPH